MSVLDLSYGNDMSLSILVENVRKMNDFFLGFGPKIGLKITRKRLSCLDSG